jgi:Replication initiation factor
MVNVAKMSSTVDYLTITAKGQSRAEKLLETIVSRETKKDGQLPLTTPWWFKGFRGFHSPGVSYGTRGQSEAIVQLSGYKAHQHYRALAGLWDNCSRIDLAVTVVLAENDKNVALRAYNAKTDQVKMKTTYIQNNRGGSTFYLGSRSSRQYGRLYDKGAERGGVPGEEWRYELELKKPLSGLFYEQLLTKKNPQDYIRGYVWNYWTSHGIETVFAPTAPVNAIEIPRDLTNSRKKLKWIERQVQPAIRELLEQGFRTEVLACLGFEALTPEMAIWLSKED